MQVEARPEYLCAMRERCVHETFTAQATDAFCFHNVCDTINHAHVQIDQLRLYGFLRDNGERRLTHTRLCTQIISSVATR